MSTHDRLSFVIPQRELNKHAVTSTAIHDVIRERAFQDRKLGGPEHDDDLTHGNWTVWLDLINEHSRKAFGPNDITTDYPNARHRLIEVAALAIAAVESFDRLVFPESS